MTPTLTYSDEALLRIETLEDLERRLAPAPVAVLADELSRLRLQPALQRAGFVVSHRSRALPDGAELDQLARELEGLGELALVAAGEPLLCTGGPVERLGRALAGQRLVVVLPSEDRDLIRRALRAGACGVLGEADLEQNLGVTLRAVSAGQICLPQALHGRVDVSAFSVRERQVLSLIAEGLTNCEIAERLFLSESTVKSHLSSSFRKLGVSSRAEAAALVLETEELTALAPPPLERPQLERELLRLSA